MNKYLSRQKDLTQKSQNLGYSGCFNHISDYCKNIGSIIDGEMIIDLYKDAIKRDYADIQTYLEENLI